MFTYAFTTEGYILRSDGALIPLDFSNDDYMTFVNWVAAGGQPTPPPTPPPPVVISPGDFLARFTANEQTAVQTACLASAQLQLGLTVGLALGQIDLGGVTLQTWMAGLVAVGAITQARATAIMTP